MAARRNTLCCGFGLYLSLLYVLNENPFTAMPNETPDGVGGDSSAVWRVPATRRVLDSVGDWFLGLDRRLGVEFVNRAGAARFGELVGRNLGEVWPDSVAALAQVREPGRFEFHLAETDEWFEFDVQPVGEHLHVYGRDLTERKRTEEMARVTDSAPLFLSYLDQNLVYRYCNQAYVDFFGRPKEAFLGKYIGDALGPAAFATTERYLRAALRGEESSYSRWIDFAGKGRRFIRSVFRPYVAASGQIEGVFITAEDETQRQTAEDRLTLSEERLRFALESAQLGTWDFDASTGITVYSEAVGPMFGRAREAFPLSFEELDAYIHPEDREYVNSRIQANLERNEPYQVRCRVLGDDGQVRWVESRGALVRDDEGRPTAASGVILDVTEQTQAEGRLRESEERYRTTFANAAVGIAHVALDGRWIWFNDALVRIVGYPREELLQKTFGDITHPEDLEADLAQAQRLEANEIASHTMEKRYFRADGSVVWVNLTASIHRNEAGQPLYFIAVVEDISSRKQAEEALRRSEERLQYALSAASAGVWQYDPATLWGTWDARCFELFGFDPSEGQPTPEMWMERIHPDDQTRVWQAFEAATTRQSDFRIEYRLRHPELGVRWLLSAGGSMGKDDPLVTGISYDITEERSRIAALEATVQVGQALATERETERIVQALTDASTDAIGAEFGAFFYATPDSSGERFGLYVLSGAPREAFASFPAVRTTPLFTPTFRDEGTVRSADVAKDPRFSGMPEGHLPVMSYLAVTVRARNGEVLGGLLFGHRSPGQFTLEHERMVEAFASQASIAYENAVLYGRLREANEDLERKVRERTAELQAANEQMEGFTYHVSHDLRAPLRAIVATSRMVQEDYGEKLPEEAQRMLDRQADAANKLGQLIDDLLKLSRLSREEIAKRPLDLSDLAREAAADAFSGHPDTAVTVEVQDGMRAEADPRLLKLALANLIENAVKYSPAGGTVRVGQREDGAFFVSDVGIGIEAQYLERIFEPFQRLHRDSEFAGTGIGLTNVRQVIERHGGRIWAESEPGRSSTFWFTLG